MRLQLTVERGVHPANAKGQVRVEAGSSDSAIIWSTDSKAIPVRSATNCTNFETHPPASAIHASGSTALEPSRQSCAHHDPVS